MMLALHKHGSLVGIGSPTLTFKASSQFRGDPGLFGFLGGIAKTALGVATGGISSAVERVFNKPSIPVPLPPTVISNQQGGPGGTLFANPFQAQPITVFDRFKTAGQALVPGGVEPFGNGGGGMPGHHLNKSDYWLKDGTFVPKGSRWVKNRRRNPLNPRAASRAISRLESAKKATAKINRITIRKAPCKR